MYVGSNVKYNDIMLLPFIFFPVGPILCLRKCAAENGQNPSPSCCIAEVACSVGRQSRHATHAVITNINH